MAIKVLVIDDSPTIRSIVQVYLMGRSMEFVEASTGVRGLQIVRLMPINLVVADVNMPEMDGITFVQQLRAEPDLRVKSIPVLLLTGDKSEGLKSRGIAAGANGFLQKPITSAGLLEAVDKLFPSALKAK